MYFETNDHHFIVTLASVLLAAKLVTRNLITSNLCHFYNYIGVTEHELEEVERHVLSLCSDEYKLWWDSVDHVEKLESELRVEEKRQFALGWKEKLLSYSNQ